MVPLRPSARAFLITVLDAALIISASAAVVILLGGRTRFDIGGLRVTLRAATNLLVFAAAFGALRLWLGRGQPLLPALPRPGDTLLETERARFAAPRRPPAPSGCMPRPCCWDPWFWIAPHIRHPRVIPDPGDPLLGLADCQADDTS